MHILYLHQYFCPPGGAGNNRSYEIAKRWVEKGNRVTMVTSTAYYPEDLKKRTRNGILKHKVGDIEVIALPVAYSHFMPFNRRIRAFLEFYSQARKCLKGMELPDLIYASSTPPSVGELGRKAAKEWGIPFIFETVDVWPDTPEGMGILQNPILLKWLHKRVNRIYRESKLIVALSPGMEQTILRKKDPDGRQLVAPEKVFVSMNGTNLSAFHPTEKNEKATIQVLYAGTVGQANGVDALIRVARSIQEKGRKDICFSILGNGNDRKRVQRLADGLENVEFIEAVPKEQVSTFFAHADIGVVTFAAHKILEDNSANKFYDYAAAGLPIVINYEGWQAEWLKTYGFGLSSPMGDDQAFEQNILLLADSKASRAEMGEKGRKVAASAFDRVQIADSLLSKMETILKIDTRSITQSYANSG